MKLNVYQKFILLLYGCLFVYFTIIHVPFKSSYHNEIKYDTLFSISSNLDTGRLVLIILILSILAIILLLLLRNINPPFKTLSKKAIKIIFYSIAGLAFLLAATWGLSKFVAKKKAVSAPILNSQIADSSSIKVDSTASINIPPFLQKKAKTCTEEHALQNFKSYMKFYFPDWKIYGNPVIKEQSDCTYRIQFTTLDPHIKYEKEIIIVEISYNDDYTRYKCRTIRGTLY